MESNSEQNRIHCSKKAAALLHKQHPHLPLKARGKVHIKGKGEMQTYWVNEYSRRNTQHSALKEMANVLVGEEYRNETSADGPVGTPLTALEEGSEEFETNEFLSSEDLNDDIPEMAVTQKKRRSSKISLFGGSQMSNSDVSH